MRNSRRRRGWKRRSSQSSWAGETEPGWLSGSELSVELTGKIEIQHDLDLVFKSNQSHVQRLMTCQARKPGAADDWHYQRLKADAWGSMKRSKAEEARLEAARLNLKGRSYEETTEIQRKRGVMGLLVRILQQLYPIGSGIIQASLIDEPYYENIPLLLLWMK